VRPSLADGFVDLGDVPRAQRDALLADLDADGDGRLTPADLAPLNELLSASTREMVNAGVLAGLDRNGDGVIDLHDLPAELLTQRLRAYDADGDGLIDLGELTRGQRRDAAAAATEALADFGLAPPSPPPLPAMPPPARPPAHGPDAGAVFGVIVLVGLLGALGWVVGRAFVRRRRDSGRKQMLEVTPAAAGDFASAYHAPAPLMSPLSADMTTAAATPPPTSTTKNTGALARARAANAASPACTAATSDAIAPSSTC
jgi:hypothetical protein